MTELHKVLVVDDDDSIRETIVEFLQDSGYEAVGAGHGGEALDKLSNSAPHPCLIILDLMMPVMDGVSFRQRQLQDPALSEIPVVVISAYQGVSQRAEELSAAAHLAKPLRLADVLKMVERYC